MANKYTVTGEDLNIQYFDYQYDYFFNEIEGVTRKVAPKGRRSGFTHGGSNATCDKGMDGLKGLWVDTVQTNLDRYVDRYFYGSAKNPGVLRQLKTKYWKYNRQAKELRIFDGIIDFRSAERPENMEGFGYDFIMLNEAGIILQGRRGRRMWNDSILPMAMDNPKCEIFFFGTPKGMYATKDEDEEYTLYYELAEKYKTDPAWSTKYYSTDLNPLLSKEAIEQTFKDTPDYLIDQNRRGKFINAVSENIFKRAWFQIVDPHNIPPREFWSNVIISLDSAYKPKAENDESAFTCWLKTKFDTYYLLHAEKGRWGYPDLKKRMVKVAELIEKNYYFPDNVLIEDKASGQSLIQEYANTSYRVLAYLPRGNKITRANFVTPLFEEGKVFLLRAPWNNDYINYMCRFNTALDTPDDWVDSTSQALDWLKNNNKTGVRSKKPDRRSKKLRGFM